MQSAVGAGRVGRSFGGRADYRRIGNFQQSVGWTEADDLSRISVRCAVSNAIMQERSRYPGSGWRGRWG